jgi:hypothetical protein
MKLIKIKLEAREERRAESDVYLKGVRLPRLETQRKAQRCFLSAMERYECKYSAPVMVCKCPQLTNISAEMHDATRSADHNTNLGIVHDLCENWRFTLDMLSTTS